MKRNAFLYLLRDAFKRYFGFQNTKKDIFYNFENVGLK
jgi:hypothetical protein